MELRHVPLEIDSRMPLCERVKMNKRRRSATNEKPKYAEVSSDDDSSSIERKYAEFNVFYTLSPLRNQGFIIIVSRTGSCLHCCQVLRLKSGKKNIENNVLF